MALPSTRRSRPSIAFLAAVVGLSLLSCGREVTGPEDGVHLHGRLAAVAFDAQFVDLPAELRASDVVPFDRVRVRISYSEQGDAKDTTFAFPETADSINLALTVPLPADAPDTGVTATLRLLYLNAQNVEVFRGGPMAIHVQPLGRGGSPQLVQVPVSWVPPGAIPMTVGISPKTGAGAIGDSLTFAAVVQDLNQTVIPNTPVAFTSSDTALATVGLTTGKAKWKAAGQVKIIAQTLNGRADTATFTVTPPAPPGQANTWTGGVSSAWSDPANWSKGAVPSTTDTVVVEFAQHALILDTNPTIAKLVVEADATLDLSSGHNLRVTGDVLVDEAATMTGASGLEASSGRLLLSGDYVISGPVNAPLEIEDGNRTISGVVITQGVDIRGGVLVVGSGDLTINGELRAVEGGLFSMTDNEGLVTVHGSMDFDSGTPSGVGTGGLLILTDGGLFGSTAFSGNHITRFAGTDYQQTGCECAATTQFGHLDLQTAGHVNLSYQVITTGDVTIGPSVTYVDSYEGVEIGGDLVDSVGTRWQVEATWFNKANPMTPPVFTGDVYFERGKTLTDSLVVGNRLWIVGGQFVVDGHLVRANELITSDSGALVMQNAADTVLVTYHATFQGSGEAGQLTAGLLQLGGHLTEGAPAEGAFAASGTHTTRFVGDESSTVSFDHGGETGSLSHFGHLELAKEDGGQVVIGTNGTYVTGTLRNADGAPQTVRSFQPFATMLAKNADLHEVTFDSVALHVTRGTETTWGALDRLTFTRQDPTISAQLFLSSQGGTVALIAPTFTTVPNAGNNYLWIWDTDFTANGVLTVNVTDPTPAGHGGRVNIQFDGAINGWPENEGPGAQAVTWSGAVSAAWSLPGNWVGGVVPTEGDTAVIVSASNAATLDGNVSVGGLRVEDGASLNLGSHELVVASAVHIGVDATVNGVSPGGIVINGPGGTITGAVPALRIEAGTVIASDSVIVQGAFDLAGGAFNVGTATVSVLDTMIVRDSGELRMTGAGVLEVNGTLTLASSTPQIQLMAGTIHLGQELHVVAGAAVFSVAHVLQFLGGSISLVVADTAVASFANVNFANEGTVTLPDAFLATGTVTVGSNISGVLGVAAVIGGDLLLANDGQWMVGTTQFTNADPVIPTTFSGNLIFAAGVQLNANLDVGGIMSVTGGPLDINGHYLRTNSLQISGPEAVLRMVQAADTVEVTQDLVFAGSGSSVGQLTDGVLEFSGELFTVFGAGTAGVFAPSGNHVTRFSGTDEQAVQFTSAPGSFFHHLSVVHDGGLLEFYSDTTVILVNGILTGSAAVLVADSDSLTLVTAGADVDQVQFDRLTWRLVDGAPITNLNALSFINQDTTRVQFEIARASGVFTLNSPSFAVTPTIGFYLRLVDTNTGDGNVLEVQVTGSPEPVDPGVFVQLLNGALLNGWGAGM